MLIESGADVNDICEEYGGKVLDIFRKKEHKALVDYLQNVMGEPRPV